MEYKLTKDICKEFVNELKNEKKLSQYLKKDIYTYFDYILFAVVVLFLVSIVAKFNVLIYILMLSVVLFFRTLLYLFSTKFNYESIFTRNKFFLGKDINGDINITNENINILTNKYVFSFHVSQILQTIETKSYYYFLVSLYSTTAKIVIPKEAIGNIELSKDRKEIPSYKNNLYSTLIVAIAIFILACKYLTM